MDVPEELGYALMYSRERFGSDQHGQGCIGDEMNDNPVGRKRRVAKAGTKAATDVRTVAAICQQFGYDPIEAIIAAVQGEDLTPAERVRTAMGLAEYIYPKLARNEITGANGGPVTLKTIERRIVDPKN